MTTFSSKTPTLSEIIDRELPAIEESYSAIQDAFIDYMAQKTIKTEEFSLYEEDGFFAKIKKAVLRFIEKVRLFFKKLFRGVKGELIGDKVEWYHDNAWEIKNGAQNGTGLRNIELHVYSAPNPDIRFMRLISNVNNAMNNLIKTYEYFQGELEQSVNNGKILGDETNKRFSSALENAQREMGISNPVKLTEDDDKSEIIEKIKKEIFLLFFSSYPPEKKVETPSVAFPAIPDPTLLSRNTVNYIERVINTLESGMNRISLSTEKILSGVYRVELDQKQRNSIYAAAKSSQEFLKLSVELSAVYFKVFGILVNDVYASYKEYYGVYSRQKYKG